MLTWPYTNGASQGPCTRWQTKELLVSATRLNRYAINSYIYTIARTILITLSLSLGALTMIETDFVVFMPTVADEGTFLWLACERVRFYLAKTTVLQAIG